MKIILLAAFAAVLPVAAADLTGSWTLTGDVVGNAVNMKCDLKQDGAKLTGTCNGPAGATPTTGSVANDKVTFQNTVMQYDLTFTGTLDASGNAMNGEIAVAGVSGTFSATRPAAAAAAAAKPDIAGNWTITGDVVGNAINMKCSLKRDGEKVSGNCNYQGLGDSPTSGTVAGDQVTLQNHVVREQPYDLTYYVKLDESGNAMKGEIAVAGVTGTFTGTRDK